MQIGVIERIRARKEARTDTRHILPALFVVLAVLFLFSFCIGRYGVPFEKLVRIFVSRIYPLPVTWTPEMEAVALNIRLPRILLCCLVGASLSAAGAAYQGVLQNPMASPDILGASTGAGFGAALAIYFGAASSLITVSAFLMSLITIGGVFLIGRRAPGHPVVNLILAGIMVGSLFQAGTSYIKLVADPTNQLPEITYWLMGSLAGVTMKEVRFAVTPMLLGLIPLYLLRWRINILTMGDEEARTLGVNANLLRLAVIVTATLVTAASVSVSGVIGWVGLVIPHLCRRIASSDYKYVMPASMLLGAAFLLVVDNVSRNLLATEIPIGILTAFVGAPFFLYLILRKKGAQ